jgi:hypothetical protein
MKTLATIPVRMLASDHLAKAKILLGRRPDQEIHACLEPRLAIEALAYETPRTYSEDPSQEINAAPGVLEQVHLKRSVTAGQHVPGVVQKPGCLQPQRVTPSRRIAIIIGRRLS